MTTIDHDHVAAPLIVERAADIDWDASHDVVIVGFGGAGVAAAIEAADAGADVAAVDRFMGGGATAVCGNVVYAGGGTPEQMANGIEDTPDAMFRYLKLEGKDVVEDATLRRFCDGSRDMLDWLKAQGVTFSSRYFPKKISVPPARFHLYYSGNEAVPRYIAESGAPAAARGHRAKHPTKAASPPAGRPDLYTPLKAAAIDKGVTPYYLTAVQRLIQDAEGAIVGVEATSIDPNSADGRKIAALIQKADRTHFMDPGGAKKRRRAARVLEDKAAHRIQIRARRGVILATGGFINNPDMVARYAPGGVGGLPLAATGCDGSGIALGASVGGATNRMDRVSAWRFINPPTAWPTGILVDGEGGRLCDESVYGATIGEAIVDHADGKAFLIIDGQKKRATWRQVLAKRDMNFFALAATVMNLLGNMKRFRTVTDMATFIGCNADRLEDTLAANSRAASGEEPDAVQKDAAYVADLQPPYYVIDMSISKRSNPTPMITLGGLKVEEVSGHVIRADGSPIGGLYAAGRTAIGICSQFYISGLSVADCIFSGRRAGRHAATAHNQTNHEEN